jgi:hypothetical protein
MMNFFLKKIIALTSSIGNTYVFPISLIRVFLEKKTTPNPEKI